ncbi:MAG TPA: low affinity iron permease family protein [Gemmatimonadaceae bacterium]|jgi:low affinity Fe/Cu permease|nr:low affinity iron permease family protein [Gemmatimonadaceae bacterium]
MTVPSTPGSAGFDWFRRFSQRVARSVGAPWAFAVALIVVVGWAITGPVFHYSNTWQLIINTGTTIITFLMVFVIQNTQNRDSQVTQLKLDELIRAIRPARNELVNMEGMSDDELLGLQRQFEDLRRRAEAHRLARRRAGDKRLDDVRRAVE